MTALYPGRRGASGRDRLARIHSGRAQVSGLGCRHDKTGEPDVSRQCRCNRWDDALGDSVAQNRPLRLLQTTMSNQTSVTTELEQCGYAIFHKVIFSDELVGVPQRRERLYIVVGKSARFAPF